MPEQLGDVLALMGDAVDNVPGIRGVGPKTASKLIVEHGDLESVLAAAPAMKPSKLRDSLIEQADMARLSKVLVTLKDDCPLPNELDDFLLKDIPPEPLGDVPAAARLHQPAAQAGRERSCRCARAVSARQGASRTPIGQCHRAAGADDAADRP